MFFILLALVSSFVAAAQSAVINHQLEVSLDPAGQRIEVVDQMTLPATGKTETVFLLHEDLRLIDPPPSVRSVSDEVALQQYRANMPLPVNAYVVESSAARVTLRYAGVINNESEDSSAAIGTQGVFLATPAAWYPLVLDAMVTFSMTVDLPNAWTAVSQGQRLPSKNNKQGWQELNPQQEIYLLAGQYNEYSKTQDEIVAMAFLRQPDQVLANQYLELTGQYIEMYQKLIGPYPYKKFALVENVWETGYGMPSFTLLGPTVIRLPFIPYTSYPHEILHNWWGNGVYVDYRQGNWAEGLTSYLADHLLKEQRGGGSSFRRNILQGYADFVSEGKDFPLARFTARHSSSSQAVGYGKAQMLFHMLRRMLGDEKFIKGLQLFYQRYEFKTAGFSELEAVFEQVSGEDLSRFFSQWTQRTGAPEIQIADVKAEPVTNGWRLRGELRQVQKEESYVLSVPMAVTLKGVEQAQQFEVVMTDKSQSFEVILSTKPDRIDVDPEFDLFRRVSRAEIPAALSQLFGAQRALIVLPAKAADEFKQAYESLSQDWSGSQSVSAELKYDNEINALPDDRAVWLLGTENRFASKMIDLLAKQGVRFQTMFDPMQQSIVVTARTSQESEYAIGWLTAERAAAIPGLARKLPHYGKYSYLAFAGDEPVNTNKGQWSVLASPMTVMFDGQAGMAELMKRLSLDQVL